MPYEIETGVIMPSVSNSGRPTKYPWDAMAVDESFFIPGRDKKLFIPKRLSPRKFVQAVMEKNGPGSPMGLRIKRTA